MSNGITLMNPKYLKIQYSSYSKNIENDSLPLPNNVLLHRTMQPNMPTKLQFSTHKLQSTKPLPNTTSNHTTFST